MIDMITFMEALILREGESSWSINDSLVEIFGKDFILSSENSIILRGIWKL